MSIRNMILAFAVVGAFVGSVEAQVPPPVTNRPPPGLLPFTNRALMRTNFTPGFTNGRPVFTNRPLPGFTNQPLPGYTNRLLPGFTNRFPFSNQPGFRPPPFTNFNPQNPGIAPGDENPPTFPPTNRPVPPPQPVPPKQPVPPGQPIPPGPTPPDQPQPPQPVPPGQPTPPPQPTPPQPKPRLPLPSQPAPKPAPPPAAPK